MTGFPVTWSMGIGTCGLSRRNVDDTSKDYLIIIVGCQVQEWTHDYVCGYEIEKLSVDDATNTRSDGAIGQYV